MKSSFKRAKWYIVGVIMMLLITSISITFSTWDNTSLKFSAKGNGGKFTQNKVNYGLAEDKNSNKIADVGDIITFGKYYQSLTSDGELGSKTPLRWIVVDKIDGELTLLTESVVAFGSFWGAYYYDENNLGKFAPNVTGVYYQNYSLSTMRAWLNSYTYLRNDGSTPIDTNSAEPRFRGFLSEAFSADEQASIIDKTISGMQGCGIDDGTIWQTYPTITDRVWVPSWTEIYGDIQPSSGAIVDGYPNKQFSYFAGSSEKVANPKLVGKTTAFASSKHSNYTYIDAVSIHNQQSTAAGTAAYWALRSRSERPDSKFRYNLAITIYGTSTVNSTDNSRSGIRPAIIIAE